MEADRRKTLRHPPAGGSYRGGRMGKIQPLADRIVAEPLEASEKTESGFYLPQDAKEKPQLAKVKEVGKDVKEVKKGDTIVYPKFGTTEVKIDNDEYMILKEEDVLGVVK